MKDVDLRTRSSAPSNGPMSDQPPVDVAMFQAAIDTACEAVFWVDREGRFAYLNERACSWLGYARDELGALRIWDVDVGTSPERWCGELTETLIDGLTETTYRR